MLTSSSNVGLAGPNPLLGPTAPLPWILAARPATVGLAATIAVALASALVLIQPGAAEAGVATAIVAAAAGA